MSAQSSLRMLASLDTGGPAARKATVGPESVVRFYSASAAPLS